jgi:hypothetical protein
MNRCRMISLSKTMKPGHETAFPETSSGGILEAVNRDLDLRGIELKESTTGIRCTKKGEI